MISHFRRYISEKLGGAFGPLPVFFNCGVDTFRFTAIPDGWCAQSGKYFINTPTGGELFAIKIYGAVASDLPDLYTFEVSAKRFFENPAKSWLYLAQFEDVVDVWASRSGHCLRLDYVCDMSVFDSMLTLSHCTWYGRRSLQKKRQPWAFWPSKDKTVKFYNKRDEFLASKAADHGFTFPEQSEVLRFEVCFRNSPLRKVMQGFLIEQFANSFLHIFKQIVVSKQIFSEKGIPVGVLKIVTAVNLGVFDCSKASQREKVNYNLAVRFGLLDSKPILD